MPLTIHRYEKPEELTPAEFEELQHLYETSPEFADGEEAIKKLKSAMIYGDVLYTAEFNAKKIGAIWSRGEGEKRVLQYIVIHPANRGRGIGEQLVRGAMVDDNKRGVLQFEAGCGAVRRILMKIESEANTNT